MYSNIMHSKAVKDVIFGKKYINYMEIYMEIDLHAKSVQLLERIANSVYERETNTNLLFFSSNEVQLVEDWLDEFSHYIKEDCVCLSE